MCPLIGRQQTNVIAINGRKIVYFICKHTLYSPLYSKGIIDIHYSHIDSPSCYLFRILLFINHTDNDGGNTPNRYR